MIQLLSVIALILAVGCPAVKSATTTHDYFDSNSKSAAERIQNLPTNLNQLLSLEQYRHSEELEKALQGYKNAAAKVKGKSCEVNETRFDDSFQKLVKRCVPKAVSRESKEALKNGMSKAIAEVQLIDESLYLNAKLFPPSDNPKSPGEIAKTKAQESIKKVLDKTNALLQKLFHTTKTAMDVCIKNESDKLWGTVIDATKAVPSC